MQTLDINSSIIEDIHSFFENLLKNNKTIRYGDDNFSILKRIDLSNRKNPNIVEITTKDDRNMVIRYNDNSACISQSDTEKEITINIFRWKKKWQHTTAKIKTKEFEIELGTGENDYPLITYKDKTYKLDKDSLIYENVKYGITDEGELTYNSFIVDETFKKDLIDEAINKLKETIIEMPNELSKRILSEQLNDYTNTLKTKIPERLEDVKYVLKNLNEIKKHIKYSLFTKEELEEYINAINNCQSKKLSEAIELDQLIQITNTIQNSKKEYQIEEDNIKINKNKIGMNIRFSTNREITILPLSPISFINITNYPHSLLISFDNKNVSYKYLDSDSKNYTSCMINSDDLSKLEIRTMYDNYGEEEYGRYLIDGNTIKFSSIEYKVNEDGSIKLISDRLRIKKKFKSKEEENQYLQTVYSKTDEIVSEAIKENRYTDTTLKDTLEEQKQEYMIEQATKEAKTIKELAEEIKGNLLIPAFTKKEISRALSLIEKQESKSDTSAQQYKKEKVNTNQ